MATARTMHLAASYWGFVLMSLHLGLHWRMILGIGRKLKKKKLQISVWILRLPSLAIAGYGLFCFINADIPSYMFLKNQFVFFDFEQNAVSVFAEYVAMMGFWIFIGHYMAKAFKKVVHKHNKTIKGDYLMSKKILVAFFSASGVTAKAAQTLAEAVDADLFEIKPEQTYTSEDLNWSDQNSRSSVEMNNPSCRPAIKNKVPNMEQYETVFVGFPIWWYVAPKIINTFLESYDFTNKKIIPFATSGGSGMGNTNTELEPSCPGAVLMPGRKLDSSVSKQVLKTWAEKLGM